MIAATLNDQIKEALKKGDSIRVSTLRLLSNALHNEWIAKQKELTEEDELAVLRRQVKQREEAIEAYEKAGRKEQAESEKKEAEILKEFLPAQMSDEGLTKIVEHVISEVGAAGPQDFGRVMGMVMQKVSGRADGKRVEEKVKEKLKS
ncbi:MAG: GatB/YqeY domain-containing protein [Candidatus Blackburnbacteria bacterium]|nr:GatB/YqeY domain-containing protein [Candidatus Blackburnbacteria bacterium]